MIKVSVVIPVYNIEAYLPDCLDSVISQSLVEIEIICVNDASTDSSMDILKKYAARDERIRIISCDENRGQAHARNLGLEKAVGEYIYFVDADDMVKAGAFKDLYRIAREDDLELICFEAEIIYENESIAQKYPYVLEPMFACNGIFSGREYFIRSMEHDRWPRAVWRQFWSRKYLMDHDLCFRDDASPHEDNLFSFQAIPSVRRMRYDSGKYYFYRRRSGSVMTGGVTMHRFCAQSVTCAEVFRFCQQYQDMMDTELGPQKCFVIQRDAKAFRESL